ARPDELITRVQDSCKELGQFRLRLGPLKRYDTDDGIGVSFRVDDVEGGLRRARELLTRPDFTPGDVEPHLTIVHPRTSRRGAEAWLELRSVRLTTEFEVCEIAVTAWDGQRWPTVASFTLASSRSQSLG